MRSDAELLSIPPRLGESIGLTDRAPKTASLLFDRVVTVGAEPCPAPIGFTAFDFGQQRQGGRTIQYEFVIQDGGDVSVSAWDTETAPKSENVYTGNDLDAGLSAVSNFTLRAAAEEIRLKLGFGAYPVYHSTGAYSAEYKPGNYEVVIASLDNLKIVHEDSLDWQQILDFRSDEDARRKYRRMVHWLDSSMVGKSQSFVQDELAIKMETYETALRKHGIRTSLGILVDVLDPKVLVAGAAVGGALSQLDSWLGVLAGSGVTLANIAVKTAKNLLDLKSSREEALGPIAYVFELRKRFG